MRGNSVSSHSLLHNVNIREADQCPIILPIATWYNTGLFALWSVEREDTELPRVRNYPSSTLLPAMDVCCLHNLYPLYCTKRS